MNILEIQKKPNTWGDDPDNFTPNNTVISSPKEGDEPFVDTVVESLKGTKDLLVGESKTLAPSVVDTFKRSTTRLDEEKRVFAPIPNSLLYYSLMAIGLIIIAKNL
jgi:hypothetical protein